MAPVYQTKSRTDIQSAEEADNVVRGNRCAILFGHCFRRRRLIFRARWVSATDGSSLRRARYLRQERHSSLERSAAGRPVTNKACIIGCTTPLVPTATCSKKIGHTIPIAKERNERAAKKENHSRIIKDFLPRGELDGHVELVGSYCYSTKKLVAWREKTGPGENGTGRKRDREKTGPVRY